MSTGFGKQPPNLIGRKFGRLTIINNLGIVSFTKSHPRTHYECLCECGNRKTVSRNQLLRGKTMSCGCLFEETLAKRNTTHGGTKTRLFRIWGGMIARCEIKTASGYRNYGAKGITVQESWRMSFLQFKNDVGEPPSPSHTLDRIDTSKGYNKENCRWATRKRQSYNSSVVRLLTYEGYTASLADWGRASGLGAAFGWRVRRGWETARALTERTVKGSGGKGLDEILINIKTLLSTIDD